MGFDESIFQILWNRKKIFKNKINTEKACQLKDVEEFLIFLSTMISGEIQKITTTNKRPHWLGNTIKLPAYIQIFDHRDINRKFYSYLCLCLVFMKSKKGLNKNKKNKLIESWNFFSEVEKEILNHFSGLEIFKFNCTLLDLKNKNEKELHLCLPKWFPVIGDMQNNLNIDISKTDLEDLDALSAGTEREAKSFDKLKMVQLNESDEVNPVTHFFEKTKTVENFKGGKKIVDGDDELANHEIALGDLDMSEVTRSSKQTKSLYKAELDLNHCEFTQENEKNGQEKSAYFYDEWNYKTRSYKKKWCTLIEIFPDTFFGNMEDWKNIERQYKKEITEIRKSMENIFVKKRRKLRQPSGDEIDIDEAVDRKVSQHINKVDMNKIYVSKENRNNDLASYILLDSSLSTESWIAGRQVLDVEKKSILVFLEAVKNLDMRIGIGGFYSNSRRDCRFIQIKGIDEKLNLLEIKKRILSLKPKGYTRIGPAIRHASAKLNKTKSSLKTLILLSDGKPSDYDAYEGTHGMSDVAQAIKEAQKLRVSVFGLAVDSNARRYFPKIFRTNRYKVLPSEVDLPKALTEFYSSWF